MKLSGFGGFGFRDWGFGFRLSGLGFKVVSGAVFRLLGLRH